MTYDKVLQEYCDLNDLKTLKVMTSINENDQNTALISITNKLYEKIVDKVDDIDFGEIPNTKGDITKLTQYSQLQETIDLIKNLLIEYKQDTKPADTILTAIENIRSRKSLFETAYKTNTELPMIMYNTLVLSIISSISYLISTSISYVKDPSDESFMIVMDKVAVRKSSSSLLYSNLEKFNSTCKNGSFDKAMDHIIKSSADNLMGVMVGFQVMQATSLIVIALLLIPMLKELIYFFYYSRVRISDYFDAQADLLQMNIYNLERSKTKQAKDIEKITKKQIKLVSIFRKIANTVQIDMDKSENSATKEIVSDNKKYKSDEIFDDVAPDSGSALF